MAKFSYRGRNTAGAAVSGRIEAAGMDAAAAQLATAGVIPVDITEIAEGSASSRPMKTL